MPEAIAALNPEQCSARKGGRISKLRYLMEDEPELYSSLLRYFALGATSAAAACTVAVDLSTINRWLRKGRQADAGIYRQFYLDAMRAVGMARVKAELKVSRDNPLAWLRNGPSRRIDDDWRDDPTNELSVTLAGDVEEQFDDGLEAEMISREDVQQSLLELRRSGLDLNALVDGFG